MSRGAQPGAALLYRQKNLSSSGVVKLSSDEEREGRKLLGIKVFVDGEKMQRVAGAQAIRKPGEREAYVQESKFNLRIVDGREKIENFGDFPDSVADDVTSERNVADRGAE